MELGIWNWEYGTRNVELGIWNYMEAEPCMLSNPDSKR